MATRASKQLQNAVTRPFTVAASQTATLGKTVALASGSETTIQDAGAASDIAIGVALNCDDGSTGVIAAGKVVNVVLFGGVIVPMLVGTGGTTAGKSQVVVSDGITDAPANGGGTTSRDRVGIALQTGVVGDIVGVLIAKDSGVSA